MWTREEQERQRVLDNLARKTNLPGDWHAADTHFINTDRRYDRRRPIDPFRQLLLTLLWSAAWEFKHTGDKDIKFERRRVDETAHKQWSKAHDAKQFFASEHFVWMLRELNIAPADFMRRLGSTVHPSSFWPSLTS